LVPTSFRRERGRGFLILERTLTSEAGNDDSILSEGEKKGREEKRNEDLGKSALSILRICFRENRERITRARCCSEGEKKKKRAYHNRPGVAARPDHMG